MVQGDMKDLNKTHDGARNRRGSSEDMVGM